MWNIWLTIATLSVASLRLKYLIYKNKSNIWSFFGLDVKCLVDNNNLTNCLIEAQLTEAAQSPDTTTPRVGCFWRKTVVWEMQNTKNHKYRTLYPTNTKHIHILGQVKYWHGTQPLFFLINRTANFWYFLLNYKESLVSIQFNDGTEAHTDMHCKSKIREAVKNKCFFRNNS